MTEFFKRLKLTLLYRLYCKFHRYHQEDEIAALMFSIFTIPSNLPVDAIVLIPGLIGEYWRIRDAVRLWEKEISARYLIIPGQNPYDPLRLTMENLAKEFQLTRTEGVIIEEPPDSESTLTQSVWISEQLDLLGVKRVKLLAAPFHLVRAYLTLLKTWQKNHQEPIVMLPVPTVVSPFQKIPGVKADSWSLIPAEIARIRNYQEKGDVATIEELRAYLQWLWGQIQF